MTKRYPHTKEETDLIVVNVTPNAAGAYSWYSANNWVPIPAPGQLALPAALEAAFRQYAPYVTLTVENGAVTAVADNPDARDAAHAGAEPEQPGIEQRLTAAEEAILTLMEVSLHV